MLMSRKGLFLSFQSWNVKIYLPKIRKAVNRNQEL
jgi:hypothetical protein